MLSTDVAIVGGGMAGATIAAMLGRAAIRSVLIDPHPEYPADFRCEKLDDSQVSLLEKTGLAKEILAVASRTELILICRRGRMVERRPVRQHAARYEVLVNAARAAIGGSASAVVGKVASIATSAERQVLTLAGGEQISARLVVLATGLNQALLTSLGFRRREISHNHSLSLGFDMKPVDHASFPFMALTYYPEDIRHRIAYLSIFPFGKTARANLFVFRDIKDPWVQKFRAAPVKQLCASLPNLPAMTGNFEIPQPVQVRPAHLYVAEQVSHDGIVLAGDALATSCPAAGTGLNKVLTDVERLCHAHIPEWLSTPGMSVGKIASFYADPAKVACDSESLARAMLTRKVATENGLRWRARRTLRFGGQLAVGALRELRTRWSEPAISARLGDTK